MVHWEILTSVTQKLTCSRLIFFGLWNYVKFVLFEVLSHIWYQNNQKFDYLSGNNPSVWYPWQHFHHDRICTTLFWTLNRSICPQHSSIITNENLVPTLCLSIFFQRPLCEPRKNFAPPTFDSPPPQAINNDLSLCPLGTHVNEQFIITYRAVSIIYRKKLHVAL